MNKEKIERIKEVVYLGIIVILLIIILTLIVTKGNKKEEKIESIEQVAVVEKNEEEKEEVKIKEYYVDVKGSVKKPGVYKVLEGTIINDVIKLAGGIKGSGTTKNINLSKKVQDEMVLYVYTTSELKKNENTQVSECTIKTEYIDTCSNSSVIVSNSNSTGVEDNSSSSNKININTATKESLMTLSGVGESKALAIIEYREKNGLFKSIEDIMNVSGIGEAAYQKIKDSITV